MYYLYRSSGDALEICPLAEGASQVVPRISRRGPSTGEAGRGGRSASCGRPGENRREQPTALPPRRHYESHEAWRACCARGSIPWGKIVRCGQDREALVPGAGMPGWALASRFTHVGERRATILTYTQTESLQFHVLSSPATWQRKQHRQPAPDPPPGRTSGASSPAAHGPIRTLVSSPPLGSSPRAP